MDLIAGITIGMFLSAIVFGYRKTIIIHDRSPRPAPLVSPMFLGLREVVILLLATNAAICFFLLVPNPFVLRLGVPIMIMTIGALFAFGRHNMTNATLEQVIISMLFHRE